MGPSAGGSREDTGGLLADPAADPRNHLNAGRQGQNGPLRMRPIVVRVKGGSGCAALAASGRASDVQHGCTARRTRSRRASLLTSPPSTGLDESLRGSRRRGIERSPCEPRRLPAVRSVGQVHLAPATSNAGRTRAARGHRSGIIRPRSRDSGSHRRAGTARAAFPRRDPRPRIARWRSRRGRATGRRRGSTPPWPRRGRARR